MRWWFFTFLCGLSFLLWLATIAIWVRSYRVSEGWTFAVRPAAAPEADTSTREWGVRRKIIVSRGVVQYSSNEFSLPPESDRHKADPVGYQKLRGIIAVPGWIGRLNPPGQRQWSRPGVAVYDRPSWVGDSTLLSGRYAGSQGSITTIIAGQYSVIISLWIPGIAFGFLPTLWMHRWLRRRKMRRAAGIPCRACFYDLTGNTSGICPECGTAILPKSLPKGAT